MKPQKVTHNKDTQKLIYYKITCPRCKQEIRAHSKKQCEINYELYHIPECKNNE